MGETKYAHRILVTKLSGKQTLGRMIEGKRVQGQI
jgi:hypothetical protein